MICYVVIVGYVDVGLVTHTFSHLNFVCSRRIVCAVRIENHTCAGPSRSGRHQSTPRLLPCWEIALFYAVLRNHTSRGSPRSCPSVPIDYVGIVFRTLSENVLLRRIQDDTVTTTEYIQELILRHRASITFDLVIIYFQFVYISISRICVY
jgi:hypothetical protein